MGRSAERGVFSSKQILSDDVGVHKCYISAPAPALVAAFNTAIAGTKLENGSTY